MGNVATALPCAICGKLVSLDFAKTDEDGQTVHEQCYVLKLKQDTPSRKAAARTRSLLGSDD
jgi:hypothetical protein